MKIDGSFLSNLRFAGDIFLRTETPQVLQQIGCRQHPYKREQYNNGRNGSFFTWLATS